MEETNMKINTKEKQLLALDGWAKETYYDDLYGMVDTYYKNINGNTWALTKNNDLVNETIDCYNMGGRVCIMSPLNTMAKWLLEDVTCEGYWMCKNLEEAFEYIREELEEDEI